MTDTEKLKQYKSDLEAQIEKLKNLPHLKIDQKDETHQQITPAGKLYKDRLNLYINTIKTIAMIEGREAGKDEGGLAKALQDFMDSDDE